MKNLLKQGFWILPLLFFLISCEKSVDGNKEREYLTIKNGVKYYKGSPYFGRIFYYHENGQLEKKESYKNGKRDGEYEEYENGKISLRGVYKDDKMDGFWETFWSDGEIFTKIYYKNDKRDGLYQSFYPPENKEVGFLVNFFYSIGIMDKPGPRTEVFGWYIDGYMEGKWEGYFENGSLEYTGFYKNSKQDGVWEEYYPNGRYKSRIGWKENSYDGEYVYFNELGHLTRGNYKNGKRDGVWEEHVYNRFEIYFYKDGLIQTK
jgi:antitoxin component YwqK of YwqJK toxin-antitoxin module